MLLLNISKKIELAANLAIVVVACLLGVALVKNYLLSKTPEPSVPQEAANTTVSEPTVSSLDVDWKQSKLTLVLALSTVCHFCTESAPFYRRLIKERVGVRTVAVLPQEITESKKYLEHLGIKVNEVRHVPLPSIGVEGTPTLVLVDKAGAIKNTWRGKLSRNQESIVLDHLVSQ